MGAPAHVPEPHYDEPSPTDIQLKVLLPTSMTGDAFSLFEEITPPNVGPPLHVHHNEDEFFRILAGEYRFQAGDRTIDAGAGDTLFVPRETPHCFCNVGSTMGRLFMGFVPGGGEQFFDWIGHHGMPDSADAEQMAELKQRFGVSFLGSNPFMAV